MYFLANKAQEQWFEYLCVNIWLQNIPFWKSDITWMKLVDTSFSEERFCSARENKSSGTLQASADVFSLYHIQRKQFGFHTGHNGLKLILN